MSVHFYTGCIRIERTDGVVLTLTELDKNITYNSEIYSAAGGFTSTVLEGKIDLSVDNAEFKVPINIYGLSRADLVAGLYDKAEVLLFVFDWENNVWVRDVGFGELGEVTLAGNMCTVEFRDQKQLLQQAQGREFQPDCDAKIGDTRCGINLASITYSGAITSVTSNSQFIDTSLIGTQSDGYYSYGTMTFTSGLNQGRSREVKDYTDATGELITNLPFPYAIAPTDTFTVNAGCDGTKAACRDKHTNVVRFRGFDMKPSREQLLKVGGQ